LLRPEQVDEVIEHWPRRCHSCARVAAELARVAVAQPWRHQVAELPPIAVRVTEHRLHGVCCPACAARTRAELPRQVPRSAFGPRLQAAVVTLAVRNRVSRRDTTELARELFGVELASGSVDAIIQRAGEALAGPYTQLEQRIKSASVVNTDETGWKTGGAGAATTTLTPAGGNSAGPTCSGTSPPTAKAWPSRNSSGSARISVYLTGSSDGVGTIAA
jgi:transposase